MKIHDIKQYGFYQPQGENTIIEALQDKDNDKEILSIMIWNYLKEKDGIKFYETDMVVLNPQNNDICDIEVEKLNQKFKIVDDTNPYYFKYGSSSVMYYKICNESSDIVEKEE